MISLPSHHSIKMDFYPLILKNYYFHRIHSDFCLIKYKSIFNIFHQENKSPCHGQLESIT